MHAHPSSRSAGRPPGRSMALTWASAVVPGLAHWVAGRRRAAVVIFSLALALLIGVVVLALTTSRTELLRMAVRPGWLTVVIGSRWRSRWPGWCSSPGRTGCWGRSAQTGVAQVGVILALAVLSLLVAAPPVAVARYAYLQRDLVTNLFPDEDPNSGLAAGKDGGGATRRSPAATG